MSIPSLSNKSKIPQPNEQYPFCSFNELTDLKKKILFLLPDLDKLRPNKSQAYTTHATSVFQRSSQTPVLIFDCLTRRMHNNARAKAATGAISTDILKILPDLVVSSFGKMAEQGGTDRRCGKLKRRKERVALESTYRSSKSGSAEEFPLKFIYGVLDLQSCMLAKSTGKWF